MSEYRAGLRQWIIIPKVPGNVQENGRQIRPCLRQFIFAGEPCEYDENIRQALKSFIGGEGVFCAAFIIMIIFVSVHSFNKWFEKGTPTDETDIALHAIMPIAVTAVIVLVSVLILHFRLKTLRLADNGEARCFKYMLHRKLCYEKDPDENEYLYYAGLGDFCVNISKHTDLGSTVTGIVVNMKGTEYFYLLAERPKIL